MLDSGRYRYGAEKLYMAVHYAVIGQRDARGRLEGAYSQLHVLRSEHMPPKAWRKVEAVLKRLRAGDGKIQSNTRKMRNSTASRLLSELWDAYRIVDRAYEIDIGSRAV